ncbi:MAG: TRL-like family protein [Spirochaetales bacterium]|jgi:hypothetical protein|nr:TRL-like family protein [Spirochaetales bacterium]
MKKVTVLLVLAVLIMSCMSPAPSLIDFRTYPVAATGNPVGSKVGQATQTNILSIAGFGNAGIAAAAKAGGITKISTVDMKAFGLGGIFGTYTTIVTGE